ncbi:hypothetical protein B0H65DRAFT_422201 [Neurospora tetraspora]|uniref:HypA-like protein n=1 Tax=Neurospora tetraspora TaxID=94610 RepID=A0AAE0JKB2_9PEZI|nr:hypothetical protein B0H65DRAFT_422201 [Neurospora tetraspora]
MSSSSSSSPSPAEGATATPHRIHITPSNTGLWSKSPTIPPSQSPTASTLLSHLLQSDMHHHHVFFNKDGFHNHIPHHLLALYGTSAPSEALQKAYDVNASYQRPVLPEHQEVVSDLIQNWKEDAGKYLGKEEYYPDFLAFFKREMDAAAARKEQEGKEKGLGYEEVVNEFLFSGTPEADNLLIRLYSGFLHPLIQLMYGLEWRQPAIVAEGLAQAAVHGDEIGVFLLGAEEAAKANKPEDMGRIVEDLLQKGVRGNEKLAKAARMSDANKVRDGVLKRAKEEAIGLAAKVKVGKEELQERTAEMYDAAVFMASAAAFVKRDQKKMPRFDFFLMHHVTSAPFFPTVNAQDWISLDTKVRLLEWKIRMDLVQYAARGAPELSLDAITSYQPKEKKASGTPEEIISNLHFFEDDGHSIKLARAARICQLYYQTRDDDYWNKFYHLIVDSVLAPGPNWVRSCGFDEAWVEIPNVE